VMIARQLEGLLGWYAEGRLKPLVSRTFPMAEAPAAMEALLSRQHPGKIVLVA
jgi:NADPH:quinone reductase